MEPRHVHDCDRCRFYRQDDEADVWFCLDAEDPSVIRNVIVRYSSDPPDYSSGLEFAVTAKDTAARRALQDALRNGKHSLPDEYAMSADTIYGGAWKIYRRPDEYAFGCLTVVDMSTGHSLYFQYSPAELRKLRDSINRELAAWGDAP